VGAMAADIVAGTVITGRIVTDQSE
jgi:hypothetical protein